MPYATRISSVAAQDQDIKTEYIQDMRALSNGKVPLPFFRPMVNAYWFILVRPDRLGEGLKFSTSSHSLAKFYRRGNIAIRRFFRIHGFSSP